MCIVSHLKVLCSVRLNHMSDKHSHTVCTKNMYHLHMWSIKSVDTFLIYTDTFMPVFLAQVEGVGPTEAIKC